MSHHQSMIDQALDVAKARLTGRTHTKSASAPGEVDLVKEAAEVANALEYVALATADDGTEAGAQRQEMVRGLLKESAAGGPKETSTTTSGTQNQVPANSKKKIQPGGTPGGSSPAESKSLDGKQPANILRQMPPATAATPKDGGGKSANATLWDILNNHKEASDKEAAAGGPLTMDAEQALPQTPNANEGKSYADSLLGSNAAPVAATKRQAKAPTRPRLAEVWDHANDTTGDASAKAVWPNAASKGDIKIADAARQLQKEGGAGRTAARTVGGGAAGAAGGAAVGGATGAAGGAALGGTAGGLIGAAKGALSSKNKNMHERLGRAMTGALGHGAAGAAAGGVLGGTAGAIGGTGTGAVQGAASGYSSAQRKNRAEKKDKEASLADYSELFEMAADGRLGEEAQAWAAGVDAL